MSDITEDTVRHLANLARIALTPAEVTTLTSELAAIVDAVAKVTEVATPDVPATSHPILMENIWRDDVVSDELTAEQALTGAPDHDGSRFRVTAILGEEA
jgi:aspartyl-tRNA(Asn)/glutamyl-tRNA(Gln) amidotransferase subunit C